MGKGTTATVAVTAATAGIGAAVGLAVWVAKSPQAAGFREGARRYLRLPPLAATSGVVQAPLAARKPHKITAHGDERDDEWYWLRDDKRTSRAVLRHLKQEATYTKHVMQDTVGVQEVLYKEMRGRIQEKDQSVPERLHGYYYYARTEEGQQYRIHCRRAVPPGAGAPSEAEEMDLSVPEEVLLDENKRKEEGKHTFYMLGAFEVSPNHKLLAFAEDTVGGEKFTLHVKDLATGKEVMEPIPTTSGDVHWAADNNTLFYVVKDHLDRPYKVFRHVIGTPASQDVVVFEEEDQSFYVGLSGSHSEKVIFISSGSAITSETRFVLADRPTDPFKVILPRVPDVEYGVVHRGQHFFITYRNKERPNSELRMAPISDPSQQTVLIPHSRDVKIEGVSVSQTFLALFSRSGGLQRVSVFDLPPGDAPPSAPLDLSAAKEVPFEEPAYSLEGGAAGDFDSPLVRLQYTSLTTPNSVIDYHTGTGQRAVKKVQPVLGGFDKALYETKRVWATAKDGVKVPISLVYRKDVVKLDGTDPFLLNGYGSYEISNDPYFSANRLCLLDRGFIFGIAHIRGGGEMGRWWYEDGKYEKKTNTFTDFIAAAEHLIALKYTRPDRLCIEGRSAGGMLMGAVVNMRPDLFSACIAGVPFVDVITTMLDETIPLTVIEWEEWGNPVTSKSIYDVMKTYSPVDNIRSDVQYPHLLATGGLHDPRVQYWEPAKFVAKLRALRPADSDRLLLLKMDMGAGHFSVTGRFEKLKEVAFEYAFLLKVQNMLDVKPAATQPAAA